jgi:DNA-binding NarL/FixJ family response regulator
MEQYAFEGGVRIAVWPCEATSATIGAMAPTVLIVDDHPSFRATARALLEAEGFEVVGEAVDAADALAKASVLRPDVVLLDVQLPDGNGFDVASRLCGNGRSPAVVLVSSRDASDYGELIPACGARGFIPKAELSGASIRALLA